MTLATTPSGRLSGRNVLTFNMMRTGHVQRWEERPE